MRTVLLSSVAALALTLVTGGLSPAHAQAADSTTPPAPSDTATPADAGAAPAEPAKPAKHKHHRVKTVTYMTDSDPGNWAHQPGTGMSGPASMKASNIDAGDTHSEIAPHLPQPKVGESADPSAYLREAQMALKAHKTGTAQQALEMAETRLLDRSTAVDAAHTPDADMQVTQVANARKALATGDTKGASSAIDMALSASKG